MTDNAPEEEAAVAAVLLPPAQAALLLEPILDNTDAVTFVKDRTSRFLLVNRRFEKLFHRRQGRFLARPVRRYSRESLPSGCAPMTCRYWNPALPSRRKCVPQDDGLYTYLSLTFPLQDAAGAVYQLYRQCATTHRSRRRSSAW